MVAFVSWEGSAGAAAMAPHGRASPSITEQGVFSLLFGSFSITFLKRFYGFSIPFSIAPHE